MKKFCDNPSCINHVDVEDDLWEYGRLSVYAGRKQREAIRHEYKHVNGRTFSVCSMCTEAANYINSLLG